MTAWVVPEGRKSVQPCFKWRGTQNAVFQIVRRRSGGDDWTAHHSKFSSETRTQFNFQIKLEAGRYGRVSGQNSAIMSTEEWHLGELLAVLVYQQTRTISDILPLSTLSMVMPWKGGR